MCLCVVVLASALLLLALLLLALLLLALLLLVDGLDARIVREVELLAKDLDLLPALALLAAHALRLDEAAPAHRALVLELEAGEGGV